MDKTPLGFNFPREGEWLTVADIRAQLLPIYFVPDESGSMSSVLEELNDGLNTLLDAMTQEGMASASIRFSIVGFSDHPIPHLEMVNLLEQENMPILGAHASTSYRNIFVDLKQRIQTDVFKLQQSNYRARRPLVFFVSDGQPNTGEDWRAALDELKSHEFKFHPTVVAYGVSTAVSSIISEVASNPGCAFLVNDGIDTGTALANAMSSIVASVVSSAQSAAKGLTEIPLVKPQGFHLPIDILPED